MRMHVLLGVLVAVLIIEGVSYWQARSELLNRHTEMRSAPSEVLQTGDPRGITGIVELSLAYKTDVYWIYEVYDGRTGITYYQPANPELELGPIDGDNPMHPDNLTR